jgi:sugar phosphate isomerase/epimerase
MHLHFKDVVGRNAVIAGTGEINLKGCLRVLKDAGFTGVLSYETEGWEEVDEAVQMITKSREWTINTLQELGIEIT